MAKKSKKTSQKAPISQEPRAAIVGFNPFGPVQQRRIKKARIVASTFTLSDGTRLLVTPVISDIRRALKQYNENGEPLYFLSVGATIKTKAPRKLLRPAKKR